MLKNTNQRKETMRIYFDDNSGDNWFYEFKDHKHIDNLINIKNCLFRNTLPEFWIKKIISNKKISYKSCDDYRWRALNSGRLY